MIIKYLYNPLSTNAHSLEGDWSVSIYLGSHELQGKLVYCRGAEKALYTALKSLTPSERSRVTKVVVEINEKGM